MSHRPLRELATHTPFARFWLSRVAGIMANQMLMVAVGWHMYDLTGRAWDLGLVGLFQFVPALLMTLPAGHIADRHHRARIFALCMLVQGCVAAGLWWATQTDHASRGLILTLSVLLGVARAFQMPAQQALTPLLVPRELLQRAIAVSSSGMEIAVISGPALGGLLYTTGASTVYALCTALLMLACGLALVVHYPFTPTRQASSWSDVFAGLTFVWERKVLLGSRLLMAVAVFGLATLGFGLSHSFGLSMLMLAITGAADNISVVTRLTLTQLETPDAMRGRVAAVNSIFIGASNQLGEFESGMTAAAFGAVGSVVLGGVGSVAIAGLWWKWFPQLAKRDRMTC
jgi:MFS family permease